MEQAKRARVSPVSVEALRDFGNAVVLSSFGVGQNSAAIIRYTHPFVKNDEISSLHSYSSSSSGNKKILSGKIVQSRSEISPLKNLLEDTATNETYRIATYSRPKSTRDKKSKKISTGTEYKPTLQLKSAQHPINISLSTGSYDPTLHCLRSSPALVSSPHHPHQRSTVVQAPLATPPPSYFTRD